MVSRHQKETGASGGSTTTATEQKQSDQSTQKEGRSGNGSAGSGTQDTGTTAVERSGAGEGAGGQATRGRGGRLARQGLQNWPVLLRAGVSISPWELVRRMSEDVNQLFETLRLGETGIAPAVPGSPGLPASRTARDIGLSSRGFFAPPIEVQQRPDAVVLRLDLPGVEADEIDVTMEDGNLIISGERRQEHREEREGLIRTEISYGTFHRSIPLPDGADEEKMTAQVRNGTLEVTIPIVARERGRRVPVKS